MLARNERASKTASCNYSHVPELDTLPPLDDYEEIAGQLGRLDAVLQRIRMGSVLVQRMKLYASDQEVLDMHDFLRKALHQLRQEEPQSLRATVRTDSFDEFRVRLQDLVSCISRGTGKPASAQGWPVYPGRLAKVQAPSCGH